MGHEIFTFITITYNQESYIEEHLESIKNIVLKYGKDRTLRIIVSDDCSGDATVEVTNQWFEKNESLFDDVNVVAREKNVGVVQNVLQSVNMVRQGKYKVLAGDDKYADENIFEVMDCLDSNDILLTPVFPFGGSQVKTEDFEEKFSLLISAYKRGKLQLLQKINNFIYAPGVFCGENIMKDIGLQKYVSQFRNIEDYPMWHYWINEHYQNVSIKIKNKILVCYRVNSGISTNKKNKKRTDYTDERDVMRKKLRVGYYILPKYMNPWIYILKFMRLRRNIFDQTISKKVRELYANQGKREGLI